jgi:uncharacterized membrane protein YfcA
MPTWSWTNDTIAGSHGVVPSLLVVLAIGAGIGFLGGLLGKGGSAIATPILVAAGVPAMIAVAAPLPATVPGTLLAADHYRRKGFLDRDVLRWSVLAGLPAAVVGAVLTKWISGDALVHLTDVLLVGLGIRLLLPGAAAAADAAPAGATTHTRTVLVAVVVGLSAGLLANSGGFLLAPLFITVLRIPVKPALGTSLAVAAALAVPGSLVHLALGHLDLRIVAVFALGSIPLSGVGARLAVKVDATHLERFYGLVLVVLGGAFLLDAML